MDQRSSSQSHRLQEKRFLKRVIAIALSGSGLVHGLTVGFIYLQPAAKVMPPTEPEMEIVLDDDLKSLEKSDVLDEATSISEMNAIAGGRGGDESIQVATLAPPQEILSDAIAPSDIPTANPEEFTDADLQPQPTPKPTPQSQSPDSPKSNTPTGPTQNSDNKRSQSGEKNGALTGSKERGLAKNSGLGPGTGNQRDGQGGSGQGQGPGDGNRKGTATQAAKPTPSPKPTPTPKNTPSPVAIVTPPKPAALPKPEQPKPAKPKPEPPKSNFGYERQVNERVATGSKARILVEYDENGKVKGGKLAGSTGDAELDAAQLRDFNRALDRNPQLRERLENRPPEKRDQPIRIRLEGEGQTDAERDAIRRNQEFTAQQEADRAAERAAQTVVPTQAVQPEPPPSGGFSIPIPAPPIDLPPAPIEPVPVAEPAPVAPAEPPPAAPVEPVPVPEPAYRPPAEPEPVPASEPVPVPEPIAEPAAAPEPIAEPVPAPANP